MCNEEIIKHMEEDMTFRGLSGRTQKSYIWRVSRYMDFHKGKDIEKAREKAYSNVPKVKFDKVHYRKDIGIKL